MLAYDSIDSSQTLLIGASGFVGRHLRQMLPRAFAPNWRMESAELRLWIAEHPPQLIINAAGRTRGTREELFDANVVALSRFFESLRNLRTQTRYVGFGSAAEYGFVPAEPISETRACAPISDYGRAKWEATRRTQALWGDRAVILRPSNVIGPGMSSSLFLGNVLQQLRSGSRSITVHRLEAVRDLVTVQDVARATCELVAREECSGIYNVSTARGVSNQEVLATVREVLGVSFDVQLSETSHQSSSLDVFLASNQKLRRATQWAPELDLPSAIRETWEALG